MKIIRFHIAAH